MEGGENTTSLSFNNNGSILAVGRTDGFAKLWDFQKMLVIRNIEFEKERGRISSLSWANNILATGSKENSLFLNDTRQEEPIAELNWHKKEVCGLRFSPDGSLLASGSNDNTLCIWDIRRSGTPLYEKKNHTAAVKALAWSKRERNILASGGGSKD